MAQGLCGTKGLCKHFFFFFWLCRIWVAVFGLLAAAFRISFPDLEADLNLQHGVEHQGSPWLRVFSTDKCFWNNPFNLKPCAWNTPPFMWEILVKSITMPFPELSCCHQFTVHLCINVRNSCPGSAQVGGGAGGGGHYHAEAAVHSSNEVLWNFPQIAGLLRHPWEGQGLKLAPVIGCLGVLATECPDKPDRPSPERFYSNSQHTPESMTANQWQLTLR